jgi:alpha-methylacyl-CoA racemase
MAAAPLNGIRVIEMAGKGAAPYAGLLLAEYGAEVVRVERPGTAATDPARRKFATLERSRSAIELDLKNPDDRQSLAALIANADVLFEGFRPGVMERLNFGPDDCQRINRRLVYGRITGWGQDGPLSRTAGHDLNFLAVSGALAAIGPKHGDPAIPLNLLADFAGGSLFLVIGVLLALRVSENTGQGQVIDASMLDGVLSLMTALAGIRARGDWIDVRGSNFLDGGAPFYRTYVCADRKHIAVGAIEPQFWDALVRKLGAENLRSVRQHDRDSWTALSRELERIFSTKSRDEWVKIFEGSDCCISPVLGLAEAPQADHVIERQSFVDDGGMVQPKSAPRLSHSPIRSPDTTPRGREVSEVVDAWRRAVGRSNKVGGV